LLSLEPSPDILFIPRTLRQGAAVLRGNVNSGCRKSRLPTTRHAFWEDKRRANLERDARKMSELIKAGWRVAVLWQCGLEKVQTFYYNMNILEDWLNSNTILCEISNNDDTVQSQ